MHSLVPECPSLDCKVMKALKSISNLHIVVENQKKWSLILLSKKSKKLTSESCSRGHLGPVCKNLETVHFFFSGPLILRYPRAVGQTVEVESVVDILG